MNEALREAAKPNGRLADALRRRQLALGPEADLAGITKGVLIVDLAQRIVLSSTELDYDLEKIKQQLGYDPLQPVPTIPAPSQAVRRSKGRKL